ncbi:MAG: hypothetical protein NTX25_03585 [Proteobacteria bacterium]|nr:hypothetical protein [Pseudomonadota bacterium]
MRYDKLQLLTLLTCVSSPIYAHKVPYNSESLKKLASESEEKSKLVAQYCEMSGKSDVDTCAQQIVKRGLTNEVSECVVKVDSWQWDPEQLEYMHKTGGGRSGSDGIWHEDYKYSKEDGWHRHAWSDDIRDMAGRELGVKYVHHLKDTYAQREVTKQKSTENKSRLELALQAGSDLLGALVNGKTDIEKSETKSESVKTSGPLDQELKDAYQKGYEVGHNNPQAAGVSPNIFCVQGEQFCETGGAGLIANNLPGKSQSKPQEDSKPKESTKSSNSDSENKQQTQTPKNREDSSSDNGPIESTSHGSWAGEPTAARPGEMWSDFDQENPGNSPLESCVFDSYKARIDEDANKTLTEGENETPEQLKTEAEKMLSIGLCPVKYYGAEFCRKFEQNKLMHFLQPEPSGEHNEGDLIFPKQKIDGSQLHFTQPGTINEKPSGHLKYQPHKDPSLSPEEPLPKFE